MSRLNEVVLVGNRDFYEIRKMCIRDSIRTVRTPLAIRSSSKLEDSHYQPFAGIYSTYMIPYVDNEDQMLRLLLKAVKSVYLSLIHILLPLASVIGLPFTVQKPSASMPTSGFSPPAGTFSPSTSIHS